MKIKLDINTVPSLPRCLVDAHVHTYETKGGRGRERYREESERWKRSKNDMGESSIWEFESYESGGVKWESKRQEDEEKGSWEEQHDNTVTGREEGL